MPNEQNQPVIGGQLQLRFVQHRLADEILPELENIEKICRLAIQNNAHVQFVQG